MRDSGVVHRPVRRFGEAGLGPEEDDALAVEEPLELRISGDTVALTMRTPGADRQLAVGFLYAEGLVHRVEDVGSLYPCGRPGEEGYGNVLEVVPAPGLVLDAERLGTLRRGTLTTSACGVCGRTTVEDLLRGCAPLPPGPVLAAEVVARAPERLREVQRHFERTGGMHAAAALDAAGQVLVAFEDVGRHNAVDKVVGALVLEGVVRSARVEARPASGARRPVVLAVSGRASFEIIQKAAVARIPVVACVSAASSLAVEVAQRAGVTLATFVRQGRFNLHTHPERLGVGRERSGD